MPLKETLGLPVCFMNFHVDVVYHPHIYQFSFE